MIASQESAVPTSSRPWTRLAMHWVRRVHLYSGLFMFPWVMLYALTAFLFNHPAFLPDREQRLLDRSDFAGTALEPVADPGEDARQVVAALNAKLAPSSKPVLRLVNADKAGYTRDVLSIRARGAGQEHAVAFDLPSGTALVGTAAQSEAAHAPFAVRGLKVPGALGERIKKGVPEALSRQGLAADEAGMSIGTDLIFFVDADGKTWRATYSVQTGAVSGRPVENPADLTTRRYLTQLHMSHGYPTHHGIRWLWAVAVDGMVISMLFWGVSGLFMWWQIKAVRMVGAMTIAASLIVAALFAIAMHQALSGP